MVKIRLRRVGAKKQPSYRVVVADSRSPRDGRFIEVIGFHNPRTEPETIEIKEDRALHWLNVGAQPSEAVARLLKKLGTTARFERLKQGEPLEELLAEAEEAAQARPAISPKTRRGHVEPEVAAPELEPSEAEEEETAEPVEAEAAAPEPEPSEAKEEAEEKEVAEPIEAEEGKEQVEETEE